MTSAHHEDDRFKQGEWRGEHNARLRYLEQTLQRLTDRLAELDDNIRQFEGRNNSSRQEALTQIWRRLELAREELDRARYEFNEKLQTRASIMALDAFDKERLKPLAEKIDELGTFRTKMTLVITLAAAFLSAIGSAALGWLMSLLKHGG